MTTWLQRSTGLEAGGRCAALNEVNLPPLLLTEAVTGQVERSLERLRQRGEGYQTLAEQKARQKVLRKKSFLSAELSVGEIKEHPPPSPKVVLPRSAARQEGAVQQNWK